MRGRSFIVLVLAVVTGLATSGRAQESWNRVYEDAERFFEQKNYAQAERLFLQAMRLPTAPKDRGVGVKRVSLQLGVIPEYYLAMIASKTGRLDEAYLYAKTVTTTKDYFKRGDARLKEMDSVVSAWNAANPSTLDRGVRIAPPVPLTPAVVGPYYALIIGIDDYVYQEKLKTPVADAQAVADLLKRDYGFETTLLLNPNRDQILDAFNDYQKRLTEKDNLLIYYAGHGYLDQNADRVYWLPVEAKKDSKTRWIISDDITASIQDIPARHILLVSDSCYSAGLNRDAVLDEAKRDRENYLRKMIVASSRSLLSSGGVETVSDGGGEGHSVFAQALLFNLSKPREDVAFTASDMFNDLKQTVAARSRQVPQYSQIRNASLKVGDVGDFVFIRRVALAKEPRH